MGADLANAHMNEGYATQTMSKNKSQIHGAGKHNLLSSQTIPGDDEEALAGAAAAASLFLSPTSNSASFNLSYNSVRMQYYFHKKSKLLLRLL